MNARIMNRFISWQCGFNGEPDAITWEADPRHVELLRDQLGFVEGSKSVVSPGVKEPQSMLDGPELELREHALFKSVCMRASFLAADRPDITFCSKECARAMSAPTEGAMRALKRLVRYLIGVPRLVWVWRQQGPQSYLTAITDSDHAGCKKTRKSTSCSAYMLGNHLLRLSSTTQATLALSSGESEFVATVKGTSGLLGLVEVGKDWGLIYKARLKTDSSSARGILARRGVGKIRHLHTGLLWIQQLTVRKRLEVVKQPGDTNVADLGTKMLDGQRTKKLLDILNLHAKAGRHPLAYRASGTA